MPAIPLAGELEIEKFKTLMKNWFEVIKTESKPISNINY